MLFTESCVDVKIDCVIGNGHGGFMNCEDLGSATAIADDAQLHTLSSCERHLKINIHATNIRNNKVHIKSRINDGRPRDYKLFAGYTARISSIDKTVNVCEIVNPLQVFAIAVEAKYVDKKRKIGRCKTFENAVSLVSPSKAIARTSKALANQAHHGPKGDSLNKPVRVSDSIIHNHDFMFELVFSRSNTVL